LFSHLTYEGSETAKIMKKGNINHNNIVIQAMLLWLILPFYDFCGFSSVAINSVYKLLFWATVCKNGSPCAIGPLSCPVCL